MPRGVPKNGFRKTQKRMRMIENGTIAVSNPNQPWVSEEARERLKLTMSPPETDAQIRDRISTRFEIMSEMVEAAGAGTLRSLIVSGPAGVGKSFESERALEEHCDSFEFVKGYVKATGLYKLLWKHRHSGSVVVFDDADSIFYDDTSLNFLKAVCDTGDRRTVSYRAEYDMEDDEGEIIPKSFHFDGTIIFLTNLDFDELINRGHKLAPHLEALVSRSHYIDLAMKSRQDYLVRIAMVVEQGMLAEHGLNEEQAEEVVEFVRDHSDTLRELSLRMVAKIAGLYKAGPSWKRIALVTCCKNY